MNTDWHIADKHITLNRYPKGQHDKSLQAWDSADEYLIQHCLPIFEQHNQPLKLTIVNDLFGALAIGFTDYQPKVITDSYVSELAIAANSDDNDLAQPQIIDSLTPWPESDYVVIKLTKNVGYLEYQLQQLTCLTSPCQVIAAGKTTLVTSNVIKLFEKYLSNVSTSLAKKKSRLILAEHGNKQSPTIKSKYPLTVNWSEMGLQISSHANVFAKEQIDIGGRFLADNLPELETGQRIIDLGCGNGLLGLACLNQLQTSKQQIELCFSDESFMAIESAKLNVTQNFPQLAEVCHFVQDDCLSSQAPHSADLILCNPPFHQQNTITEHIANQMFRQSYQTLKVGGRLLVVANRHLAYQGLLKKLFGGFVILAQNQKFVIFDCTRR